MNLENNIVYCQNPLDGRNVTRNFNIVQCTLFKESVEYIDILQKATELANLVNAGAANNSDFQRNLERRQIDSFGGLLAEAGWEQFINSEFGNIASSTPFTETKTQIDIQLINGEKLEIRSSFPRNGVKFAICNDKYNFRNIGPYSNSIKAGEIQKQMYLAVLFDTQKNELLTTSSIQFSLVAGSTWKRMMKFGYNEDLVPQDDYFAVSSNYRVVDLKNAPDAKGVLDSIAAFNYIRLNGK